MVTSGRSDPPVGISCRELPDGELRLQVLPTRLLARLTSAMTYDSFRSRSLDRKFPSVKHRGRSLRVRSVTFLPHTRRIYDSSVRMTLGFESLRPLAHQAIASYPIRVPRARSLPAASVRFAVARDTLAVRLEVPVIKASIGTFTQQVTSRLAFAYRFKASGHDASRHA